MDPEGASAGELAILRRRFHPEPDGGLRKSRKGVLRIRTMVAVVVTILVMMSLMADENLTNRLKSSLYDDSTTTGLVNETHLRRHSINASSSSSSGGADGTIDDPAIATPKKESCGVVFLHLRKTGGSYIGNILRWWLRKTTECCGFGAESTRCPSAPKFMLSKTYQNWTCPSLHFAEQEYNLYNPQVLDLPCVFSVTSIRDPVSRIVSHFLYEHATPHQKDFKARYPNASRGEMCTSFLRNETMWASYLDQGEPCPKHFWNQNALPNYFSYALDPWYADVEAIDYENDDNHPNNNTTAREGRFIGQQSNFMWKALQKQHDFHHRRCNRSLEEGVDRALLMLSKFSLVLTDAHKETWWNSLAKGLSGLGKSITNATMATMEQGRSQTGRSNTRLCGDSFTGIGSHYEGIPEDILERIRKENQLDIAIYDAWLKKTEVS